MNKDREVKLSVSTGTFVRFWLVILGFIVLAGAIWIARTPLIMLAISFFLALVLNRPVSFLARYLPGKSRTIAILIAYLLVAAMIGVWLILNSQCCLANLFKAFLFGNARGVFVVWHQIIHLLMALLAIKRS